MIEVILNERRADASPSESLVPLSDLESLAKKRRHRSLASKMMTADKPCIIAEMKKASPTAGVLCEDYYPDKIARIYEISGAAAVSVLTEPRYFQGNIEHIKKARETVGLPILRKDFICESYQIYESAAWGADVVLLIAKVLEPALMKDLYQLALSLGLEVLIESHSKEELMTSLKHQKAILGINNRNLDTLETDLTVGYELADMIPPGRLTVIESGIKKRTEVVKFWKRGYKGFLIGEALMRSDRPGRLLGELAGS